MTPGLTHPDGFASLWVLLARVKFTPQQYMLLSWAVPVVGGSASNFGIVVGLN